MLRPAREGASLAVCHPRGRRPLCDGIVSGWLPARHSAVAESTGDRPGRETGRAEGASAAPRGAGGIELARGHETGRPLSAGRIVPKEGAR
jgi:hypothetical protein